MTGMSEFFPPRCAMLRTQWLVVSLALAPELASSGRIASRQDDLSWLPAQFLAYSISWLRLNGYYLRVFTLSTALTSFNYLLSTTGMDTVAQLEQDFIRFQHVVDAGDILIGSHVLICSLMMNVLTEHPDCIIPYVSIWALMVFLPTLPLGPPFYLSTVSFTSIVIAVLMSMVAISLGWTSPHLQAFPSVPTIQYACVAVADIVFTYVGYAVFFLFSDLEDIDVIPNALVLLQTWEAILYKASAIAIHAFVGNEAITLALGAVGKLHRQISISYGVATPVLVIGAVVTVHVVVKLIYLRMVCDINSMHNRSYAGRGIWAAGYASLYIVSWVITEGIPISKDRLNGSLPVMCFPSNLPHMFRLYVKRNSSFLTQRQMMTLFVNVSILTLMLIIWIIGMCCSIWSIYQHIL